VQKCSCSKCMPKAESRATISTNLSDRCEISNLGYVHKIFNTSSKHGPMMTPPKAAIPSILCVQGRARYHGASAAVEFRVFQFRRSVWVLPSTKPTKWHEIITLETNVTACISWNTWQDNRGPDQEHSQCSCGMSSRHRLCIECASFQVFS
jgi:hypothetical protein